MLHLTPTWSKLGVKNFFQLAVWYSRACLDALSSSSEAGFFHENRKFFPPWVWSMDLTKLFVRSWTWKKFVKKPPHPSHSRVMACGSSMSKDKPKIVVTLANQVLCPKKFWKKKRHSN